MPVFRVAGLYPCRISTPTPPLSAISTEEEGGGQPAAMSWMDWIQSMRHEFEAGFDQQRLGEGSPTCTVRRFLHRPRRNSAQAPWWRPWMPSRPVMQADIGDGIPSSALRLG